MTGIYKITNKRNNKIYIGKALDIKQRWQGHKDDSFCSEEKWLANKRGQQTFFHRALRKEGIDAFTWEIIEECLPEELNEKEKYWIDYYDTFNNPEKGYNLTKGGDGYSCGGGENAPGAKLKQNEVNIIKEKLKLRWTAKEIQQIIPNASSKVISDINYGKSWFDENEIYPISIDNGHRLWSDTEAMIIKQEYAEGKTISELANKYQVGLHTISNLVNGKSYTNLPIIPRKVEWKRTNNKKRKFSDEEVIKYRQMVQDGLSILNVYNNNNIQCNYSAFRNMIRGVTYKNVGL